MTDVTINYTYKVPNECWVDDFSEEKEKTFTYSGPEVLVVTLPPDGSGYTQKLDGVVYDGETQIEINVTTNPELLPHADLLWGRPYDYEVETAAGVDENGNVTEEISNLLIHDYYWPPVYNHETGEWPTELELIVRDTLSPNMRTYIAKAETFVDILEQFSLPDADQELFDAYKVELSSYKNLVALPWKYPGVNPFEAEAPKIPFDLVKRANEIKNSVFGE